MDGEMGETGYGTDPCEVLKFLLASIVERNEQINECNSCSSSVYNLKWPLYTPPLVGKEIRPIERQQEHTAYYI
jgi:hypothetical protein